MMAVLRRSWWVAALLVILSPAGLGAVMPVLHPCETLHHDVGHGGTDGDSHQHHHAGDASAGLDDAADFGSDSATAHCTCIGACHGGTSLAAVVVGSRLPVVYAAQVPVAIVSGVLAPTPPLPLDHLPPPTAPPLG